MEDGEVSHQLWFIQSEILRVQIPGMRQSCLTMTVDKVGASSCWFSDRQIIDGAIAHLMVTGHVPDWCGRRDSDAQ